MVGDITRCNLNELQFCVLRHLIRRLHDPEDRHHDVHCAIPLVPQFLEFLHGNVNVAPLASLQYILNDDWVRLVANFEHVLRRDKPEPRPGRLEVVDGLPHVSFSREDERCEALIVVFDLSTREISLELGRCSDQRNLL